MIASAVLKALLQIVLQLVNYGAFAHIPGVGYFIKKL
jgi:hypothetical protein